MLRKLLENFSERRSDRESYIRGGRLSSRPEFRKLIEQAAPRGNLLCPGFPVVFLAGQVSHILDDVAQLREAGYDACIGIEGGRTGGVYVVDLDSFSSRGALGRMLSLVRAHNPEACIAIRTANKFDAIFHQISTAHGVLLTPNRIMEDVADILGGDVIFVGLNRNDNSEECSPTLQGIS